MHLGGAFSKDDGNKLMQIFCAILQILVLSSNTKKGEIERTFPRFCVLDNNISDLSNVWCVVGALVQYPCFNKKGKDLGIYSAQTVLLGPDNPVAWRGRIFQLSGPLPTFIWGHLGLVLTFVSSTWFQAGRIFQLSGGRIFQNIRPQDNTSDTVCGWAWSWAAEYPALGFLSAAKSF